LEAHFSRRVVAQFAGDWLTTEGGSLLLRQADRKIACCGALRVASATTGSRTDRARLGRVGAADLRLALGYED